ncbi:oleate delta-12 desaturase [Aspergillus clavatus NRRL 1]|uniref:Oleate delta-12 desaturase n=1 Tax=Aspergillus clavatus (strain ATCC 1007 / CBS 513.65 / DSM 816 / NCTC 3887 / NRRL 1 / QM 1276 / 107) TaxID=344612 RepID=A1CMK9_ASPCL|nr:oleate delta-12 desaturase [Aspergillus clavatus NRRL 1]EAW08796.1 oleate delta-12 desaturase [Aspergillus clavatus NRRL 1]
MAEAEVRKRTPEAEAVVPQDNTPSLKSLKDAIPQECFESSLVTSLLYLARDILYCAVLAYGAFHIHLLPSLPLRIVAWAAYTFFQGCVGTGLWILAHECGHGAFSRYPRINDFIGWAAHSFLLVPYFSWKITHARHHRYTGHMDRDTVFVPWTADQLAAKKNVRLDQLRHLAEETPIVTFVQLLGHQLGGWQLYLLTNATAGALSWPEGTPKTGVASHFNPVGALWTPAQRLSIALSDLGLLIMGAVLWFASTRIGVANVILLYFIPYLWVHHWLIAITYLQHTHPALPHYTAETWTYTKGALATVDRTMGFIGRHFFHEIIDYHVVHHLFSRIPFYEAERATRAIQPLLGAQYNEDKQESFLGSLVSTFRSCVYVAPSEPGVLHFVTRRE